MDDPVALPDLGLAGGLSLRPADAVFGGEAATHRDDVRTALTAFGAGADPLLTWIGG